MAKKITEQGIFNFVWKFIIRQGEPAVNYSMCEYRTVNRNNGKVLACAAGCLLTDEEALYVRGPWCNIDDNAIPPRFRPFRSLIDDMQRAHDSAACSMGNFVCNFKKKMCMVAKSHRLTVPSE